MFMMILLLAVALQWHRVWFVSHHHNHIYFCVLLCAPIELMAAKVISLCDARLKAGGLEEPVGGTTAATHPPDNYSIWWRLQSFPKKWFTLFFIGRSHSDYLFPFRWSSRATSASHRYLSLNNVDILLFIIRRIQLKECSPDKDPPDSVMPARDTRTEKQPGRKIEKEEEEEVEENNNNKTKKNNWMNCQCGRNTGFIVSVTLFKTLRYANIYTSGAVGFIFLQFNAKYF